MTLFAAILGRLLGFTGWRWMSPPLEDRGQDTCHDTVNHLSREEDAVWGKWLDRPDRPR